MNIVAMGIYIVIGYVAALAVYSVLTYIQYSVKYYQAKKKRKKILRRAYRAEQNV